MTCTDCEIPFYWCSVPNSGLTTRWHSNVLEMFAIGTFVAWIARSYPHTHIIVRTDNMTAVAAVNSQRARSGPVAAIAAWLSSITRETTCPVGAVHLPGAGANV